MILAELAHAVLSGGDPGTALDILAQEPKPSGIDTEGILTFLASTIAPILLGVLGVIFIGRANKGEVSRVLTSSVIAIVGVGFIAGAVTLVFLGEYLIGLLFK